jgi:hypothetical protein
LIARRCSGATAAVLLLLALPLPALADGSVTGTIALPDAARRGEPRERNRGFVRRQRNPLKAPRAADPMPYLIVVLDDGPIPDAARVPPREPVRYALIGESFAAPVLPIVTGASVEIKNDTSGSPRIHAPADPELIPGDPINPKGARVVKKLELKYKALELRDADSAHLSGWVVGFPHRYVARVDEAGRFAIADVPPGDWRVRIWYRDGFLVGAVDKVTVANGRESQLRLALPVELKVQAP